MTTCTEYCHPSGGGGNRNCLFGNGSEVDGRRLDAKPNRVDVAGDSGIPSNVPETGEVIRPCGTPCSGVTDRRRFTAGVTWRTGVWNWVLWVREDDAIAAPNPNPDKGWGGGLSGPPYTWSTEKRSTDTPARSPTDRQEAASTDTHTQENTYRDQAASTDTHTQENTYKDHFFSSICIEHG